MMTLTIEQRIARRTQAAVDGCLIWTGAIDSDGYPKIRADGRQQQVHRVHWHLTVGPIPEGHTLARMAGCPNRRCIAPEHLVLFEGNPAPSLTFMLNKGRDVNTYMSDVFSCGHPRSAENSVTRPDANYTACRTCVNDRALKRYHNLKARLAPA